MMLVMMAMRNLWSLELEGGTGRGEMKRLGKVAKGGRGETGEGEVTFSYFFRYKIADLYDFVE